MLMNGKVQHYHGPIAVMVLAVIIPWVFQIHSLVTEIAREKLIPIPNYDRGQVVTIREDQHHSNHCYLDTEAQCHPDLLAMQDLRMTTTIVHTYQSAGHLQMPHHSHGTLRQHPQAHCQPEEKCKKWNSYI